ncbi:MAG: hypothetical protein WCG06_04500, partial [Candidatus Omnitrophota bacterium]
MTLTILLGILIHAPYRNCQTAFLAGDHGRDLYVFQKVSEGRRLYQDMDWYYGPLTPHVYGAWMRLTGSSIATVLLAELILKIACGVVFFLIFAGLWGMIAEGLMAASGFWLLTRWFGHTYNHTEGLLFLLSAFACALAFSKTPRMRWIWLGTLCVFLTALVKFNIGFCAAASFGLCITGRSVFDDKKMPHPPLRALLWPIAAATVSAAGVYWFSLRMVSDNRLGTVMTADTPWLRQLTKLGEYLKDPGGRQYLARVWCPSYLQWTAQNHFWPIFFFACAILSGGLLMSRVGIPHKRQTLFAVFCAAVFALPLTHEAIFHPLYSYKILWAFPFILFAFLGASFLVARRLGRGRFMIYGVMAVFYVMTGIGNAAQINAFKIPANYSGEPRAKVYLPESRLYGEICDELRRRLSQGEPFLAVPYEPLFYYLTGHDSPT